MNCVVNVPQQGASRGVDAVNNSCQLTVSGWRHIVWSYIVGQHPAFG